MSLVRKHGTRAVFVGRLIPVVRNFVPAVTAGAACAIALSILFAIGVVAGVKSANDAVLVVIASLLAVLVMRKHRTKTTKTVPDRNPHDQDPDTDLDLTPAT